VGWRPRNWGKRTYVQILLTQINSSWKRICQKKKKDIFTYEYFIFVGKVASPPAKPPLLEDQYYLIIWQCVDAGTGQTTQTMEDDDDDDDENRKTKIMNTKLSGTSAGDITVFLS
jgi:hypothetical protein